MPLALAVAVMIMSFLIFDDDAPAAGDFKFFFPPPLASDSEND